tara:strand:- start:133 stop:360 length:228 start_codon:yes stop_codon:yes gene_type:complete
VVVEAVEQGFLLVLVLMVGVRIALGVQKGRVEKMEILMKVVMVVKVEIMMMSVVVVEAEVVDPPFPMKQPENGVE